MEGAVLKFWRTNFADAPDYVRVELIDMLFQTRVPLAISGCLLVVISLHMATQSANGVLYILSATGAGLTIFRLVSEVAYHRGKGRCALSLAEALRWEQLYTWSSYSFAGVIGLLGAMSFLGPNPAHQLLTSALVFGYAAGIVCRISVRPAIALPALLVVALPTAAAAISRLDSNFHFYGFILVAFLLGSFETVRFIYRQNVGQISLKHEFAILARQDVLTGLSNRLGFHERLAVAAIHARAKGDLIAVHSVDLDRFKEVNDRYGHDMGDALLRAVAGRITGILRDGDFAVRMGGDEFVVVQSAVGNHEEAMLLARRIIRLLSEPFAIDGHELSVGASIGIAMGPQGDDTAALTTAADKALYAAKSAGRNRASFAGGTASIRWRGRGSAANGRVRLPYASAGSLSCVLVSKSLAS
jgi:diguanylate cyclase (GGDEF)-like protein